MKHIVLDTNILYQEGLHSGRMKLLSGLAHDNVISIYIPDIVKKEFITKRISEISQSIDNIQNNFKSIARKCDDNGIFHKAITDLESATSDLSDQVATNVETEFSNWMKQLNAHLIEFNPVRIKNVLDDYFNGQGVFKSIKSRDDFPDSIIHHSITELCDSVDELYVILNDSGFKKGLKDNNKIKQLNSINELLQQTDISEHILHKDLSSYFTTEAFSELLIEYLVHQNSIIENLYVDNIDNTDIVEVWHYGSELNFPTPESLSNLIINNVYVISSSEITADISFEALATLSYVTDYGNYLSLEKNSDRNVAMSSMNGDGMCDLNELTKAIYSGSIVFTFKSQLSVDTIGNVFKGLVADDSAVSIHIDIEFASIIEILI